MPDLTIDFTSPKFIHRRKYGGREPIVKATSFKKYPSAVIIDATAGLGRDSFVLAANGANVIMLERSKAVFTALKCVIDKGLANSDIAPIMGRMQLIHADSIQWLGDKNPDIIYMDPMFKERQKSSLVKKDIRSLQSIVGETDDDSYALWQVAMQQAQHRVVVKRSINGEYIGE